MYYIKLNDEENELVYYCRNCGNVDNSPTENSLVITSANFKNEDAFIGSFINSYTKHDPTLPRTNTILCPNKECETNTKDKEREIIYIRYNETEMKYVYMCSTCDCVWKP
jgi:hypothetical protein